MVPPVFFFFKKPHRVCTSAFTGHILAYNSARTSFLRGKRIFIATLSMAVTKRKRNAPSAGPQSSSSHPASAEPGEDLAVTERGLEVAKRLRSSRGRDELDALRAGKKFTDAVKIIEHLLDDEFSHIFAKPVLEIWTEDEVPGYAETVTNPMDLGTLLKKVNQLDYLVERGGSLDFDVVTFSEDLRRVFKNCMLYNDVTSEYYRHARRLLVRTDRKYTSLQDIPKPTRRPAAGSETPGAVTSAANDTRTPARVGRPRLLPSPHAEQEVEHLPKSRGRPPAHVTGSSVSSEDVENGDASFIFVSTAGLEKKRGRKSSVVQGLENKHGSLTKRRRLLLDSAMKLEARKKEPMRIEEKAALCEQVAVLDFIRMKTVVDIIARGMNRQDILTESEVDMDINTIDNSVLREIQAFIGAAPVVAAHGTLESVDKEIADIEMQLVDIRFQRV